MKRNPGRIVALRIHEMRACSAAATVSGPIKDRDLRHPAMKTVWEKAQSLGLAIQMHFIPCHAPQIHDLAEQFPEVTLILDHLARGGQGTAEEYVEVLKLAKLKRAVMKYSGVAYSSKEPYPHRDAAPLVRRVYDAFGPDRIIWGSFGSTLEAFNRNAALLDEMFRFASEADRSLIRGGNALRLYGFAKRG